MRMAESCVATNAAGSSSAPTPGSGSSVDCWSAMNISSLPIEPSSISPASGSRCANVYATRSRTVKALGIVCRLQRHRWVAKGPARGAEQALRKHGSTVDVEIHPVDKRGRIRGQEYY